MKIEQPIKPARSGLASAWARWRSGVRTREALEALPCIPVAAEGIRTLAGADVFRETLLASIAGARRRILIAALYLQDDEAGREVLDALYAAKAARPALEVAVFVDWHRAQRGLIGKSRSPGNAALYRERAERFGPGVSVFGVPVQRRELMGVLHLKGIVIDDQVLYSGASLNNVYLQWDRRYRLDRYHVFDSPALADSLAGFLTDTLRPDPAVPPLDTTKTPRTATIRNDIVRLRRRLSASRYHFEGGRLAAGEVGVTPLIGVGVRQNALNASIVQMIDRASRRLVIFTPYFNLPGPIARALKKRLKAGCQVTLIVGDKVANDFYIPPGEPFKAIGALPYLYEANLRRFCKANQRTIDKGQLDVRLWRHDDNSFHLKGLLVDDDYALLTGNNLNPRAWRLDLENGLVIHDPQGHLVRQHADELARVLMHTQRVVDHTAIEPIESYPEPVRRLLRRLSRVRADRLVNQVL